MQYYFLNGIELDYTQDGLSDLILKDASGELSFDDMVQWVIKHQR